MRILIITDAWPPQVNGVVRTLQTMGIELRKLGHDIRYISPEGRKHWKVPSYNEIELSFARAKTIGKEIDAITPDAIHIATEGPLGWAARRACLRRNLPFSTSFHTRFAEYAHARIPFPGVNRLFWSVLQIFHAPAGVVMTPSLTISNLLESKGFKNVKTWTRGVDHDVFKPGPRDYFNLPRPIMVLSGRVIIDKNIEAFLKLELPGTKVIIGDGPDRNAIEAKFPNAIFTGFLFEHAYAHALTSADCFVFPSRTDTFGLVMIEAMACGTPVAAFNVSSPIDVIEEGVTGCMNVDLGQAIVSAMTLDRELVHKAAKKFTWERTAEMFANWLLLTRSSKTKDITTARTFAHTR